MKRLRIIVYTIDISLGSGFLLQQIGHIYNTATDLFVILLQGIRYYASLLLVLTGMFSVGLLKRYFLYVLNLQILLIYLLSSLLFFTKLQAELKS